MRALHSSPIDADTKSPRRIALWLIGVDLTVAGPAMFAMVLYGVATTSAAALFMSLRLVIWVGVLWALFEPLRRWQHRRSRGERVEDAVLVEADASIHRAPYRFVLTYSGTWVASLGLMVLVADTPATRPSQQVAAAFVAVSIVLASWLLVPIFRYTLDETYRELADEIQARGLKPDRPRTPLVKGIVVLFLGLMIGTMIGLNGTLVSLLSDSLTRDAIAAQRHAVELDSLRFELEGSLPTGEGEGAGAEVELLAYAQLPAELVRMGHASDPLVATPVEADDPLGHFDPVRGEVLAAVELSDGRWILRRSPHRDRSWILGLVTVVLSLFSVVPSVLAGIALNRVVLAPLRELDEAASSIAQEGRLLGRARIVAPFDDEIGDVGQSFNDMLDMLEQLARAAASVTAGDLSVELAGRGDLHDAFRDMIDKLAEVVAQIRVTSLEVASAAAEIQAAAEDQELATEDQAARVRELGATVASLALSAEAITGATQGVLANAEQTRTTTEETSAQIATLRRQSEGIGELLELIREVADRSDLLALNGSLEAVRAGESGRGFSLVAAEMRRLAERVTLSVDDVAGQLAEIQATSDATVAATGRSHALAGHTAREAEAIATETQSQSQAMDQLAVNIETVAEIAAATQRATGHTRSTAAGLHEHARELERLTSHFLTE